jgi:hypothetical protein
VTRMPMNPSYRRHSPDSLLERRLARLITVSTRRTTRARADVITADAIEIEHEG